MTPFSFAARTTTIWGGGRERDGVRREKGITEREEKGAREKDRTKRKGEGREMREKEKYRLELEGKRGGK